RWPASWRREPALDVARSRARARNCPVGPGLQDPLAREASRRPENRAARARRVSAERSRFRRAHRRGPLAKGAGHRRSGARFRKGGGIEHAARLRSVARALARELRRRLLLALRLSL